jgi:hypothetical protein
VVLIYLKVVQGFCQRNSWLFWTLHISAWLAVLSTIYSGLEYVFIAARTLRK